jgi:hypothetical protein
MDLVKKYTDLAEAWPGTPEWKKKHDPSYNPYDPEGKQRKSLKQMPYGYRAKSVADDEETPTSAEQPAMKKRGRPKKMKEDVEQIEEISKSLAMKYLSKAPASAAIAGSKYGSEDMPKAVRDRNWKRMMTRAAGAPAAVARVSGMRKTTEQTEPPFTPDKKKKPSAVAGKYGVEYSTARHLARTGMQAALKDLKKGPEKGKRQVEEVEQVSELKTSTVQSYMQKRGDRQSRVATAMKDIETGSNKSKVHSAGLKRAAARMNKLTPTAPRKWPSADEIKRGQSEIPKWWTYGT